MRVLRWIHIVAAATAISLGCRAASAQFPYSAGPGVTEVSTGTPAYPAGSVVPTMPVAPSAQAYGPMMSQPAAGEASTAGCSAGCDSCGGDCGRGDPVWRAYGDFLYLRPRNEDVEFAQPINGPVAAGVVPVQIGQTFVMNPEFAPGFRIGIDRALNECSEVALSYTYYRQEDNVGPASAGTPFVVQSLVFNPSTTDAGTNWIQAGAHDITSFQFVDLDFRHSLFGCDCSCLNYFIGMRYAHSYQEFDATFTDIIRANTYAHVNFDGVGFRAGLDGERVISGGFYGSAKADVNFVGGEFRSDFLQGNTDVPVVVTTSWRGAELVTILEAEVAVGWQSNGGHFRGSIGYLINDWCNNIRPADYINSVQTNSYHGANEMNTASVIFDGLTAHAEVTW